MHAENFKLDQYLARIGFVGEAKADFATLSAIMRCQLFSVPFENMDVQAGKIVSIKPEDIVQKITQQRRGGYCYEVNGIFAMALQALGIAYQFVAARPMFYPTRRPRTHMVVVAELAGEKWLCDLGFGSYGIRAPINLADIAHGIHQDNDQFRLTVTAREHTDLPEYLLEALVEGEWAKQFAFDLAPQEWVDFEPANFMNSTNPHAIFVQKLLVVLHTPAGRNILFGNQLKIIAQDGIQKRVITHEERAQVLQELFGLDASVLNNAPVKHPH